MPAAPRRLLATVGAALLCAVAAAGVPALACADEATVDQASSVAAPQPVDLSGQANIDFGSAVSIASGQQVTDYADGMGTLKYYRLDLATGGRVSLDATVPWQGPWSQGTFRIFDDAGNELWSYNSRNDWNSTTQQAHCVASLDLTAGTYYLVIGDDNATGSYTFTYTFTDAGETVVETQDDLNNSLATAMAVELDTAYTAQIALNDADDFYTFTLPTAGCVTFEMLVDWQGGWSDNVRLFDAAGNELLSFTTREGWNDTTSQSVTANEADLTAGTYYLAVSGSGDDLSGPYTFMLAFEDAAESFPEEQGGSDNGLSEAVSIELGGTYRGQLALNDQIDFYTFTLSEQEDVHLNVTTWWPRTYSTTMYLYDSAGNEVWNFSNGGDWNDLTSSAVSVEEVTLEAGTYYFAVRASDSSTTGPYEFCWYTGTAVAVVDASDEDETETAAEEDGPCADGTYTASVAGSLGTVEMTVSIADGRLTAVDVVSEGGVTPDEYADLFASCIAQAREAAASVQEDAESSSDSLLASIEAKLASMGSGGA